MAQKKKQDEWEDITDTKPLKEEEWEPVQDEYENIDSFPVAEKKRGAISRFVEKASTPLTDAPSRFMKSVAESVYGDTAQSNYPRLMGFLKGADEALGDVLSGFTAPSNLVPMALGAGAMGAGAKGLGTIANLLRRGTQAASVIPIYHGGETLLDKDASLQEKLFAIPEIAGGAAGAHFPESAIKPKVKPSSRFAKGEVVKAAGKEQVVTGFDEKGKPKLKIVEEQATPEIIEPESFPESEPAAEVPLEKEPDIVDKIFPGLKRSESKVRLSMEPIQRFMKDESGEFNADAILGERTPHPDEVDLGLIPNQEIDLNQAVLEAGSDMAKPVEGRRLDVNDIIKSPTGMQGIFDDLNVPYKSEQPFIGSEFGEDMLGYEPIQAEIPPQMGPEMPHEFQPDMPMREPDIADADLPVEFAFEWPDFHEGGGSERMYNVMAGPEKNSTLSETTLRSRGIRIPEMIQNFMKDESGEINFGPEPELEPGAPPPGTNLLGEEQLAEGLPIQERVPEPIEPQSMFGKIMDFPKGAMSVDLPFMTSAAFRQAKPLAWTADWFKAWGQAAKAYGSETAAAQIDADIMNSKYFKPRYKPSYDAKGNLKGYKEMPSIAEENGVKMTKDDFTGREEYNRSQLAEKLPGPWGDLVKRSNRAYGAFLNHLRKTKFEQLMDQTKWSGTENDATVAKSLAEFVNDATGRGSLKWEGPGGRKANLERYAPILQNAFWSPRLIASNTKFLNPFTYTGLPPQVRQQYINGTLRMAATWVSFAGLAKMAGADVNLDPTNSDFGKIKIGDMRIDPAGGLQQLIVFAARELPKAVGEAGGFKTGAFTSSATNKTKEFGKGAFPIDRASVLEDFTTSKLNPMWKLAYDLMRASDKRPVHLGDRAVQMALPLMAQDLMDVMKKDPDLAKLLGVSLSSSVGMGTAFYGKNEKFNEPVFTDELEDLFGAPHRSLSGTVGKF